MKNSILFFLLMMTDLIFNSCQKPPVNGEPGTSNSFPLTECDFGYITYRSGGKLKFFDVDGMGRILTATFKPSKQQNLIQLFEFTYQSNSQLKNAIKSIYFEGNIKSKELYDFTYDASGLLTKFETYYEGSAHQLSSISSISYNSNKQITELLEQEFTMGGKSRETFDYDTEGNLTQVKYLDTTGKIIFETSFTYDGIKNAEQLIKGIPFNLIFGGAPWKKNMPLKIVESFIDDGGKKQTIEINRTDILINANGYGVVVEYGAGNEENYVFPCH